MVDDAAASGKVSMAERIEEGGLTGRFQMWYFVERGNNSGPYPKSRCEG